MTSQQIKNFKAFLDGNGYSKAFPVFAFALEQRAKLRMKRSAHLPLTDLEEEILACVEPFGEWLDISDLRDQITKPS